MLENNLAYTYALQMRQKLWSQGREMHTTDAETIARSAITNARCTISLRYTLDLLSAAVYFCTGNSDYAKSLLDAHKDVRQMVIRKDNGDVLDYIQNAPQHACVNGLYRGWIVMKEALHGDKVFDTVRKEMKEI